MDNEEGMAVYPAVFTLEGEGYKVYFPDFGVTGKGFKDLDETVEFASNMLGEIILDYASRGLKLPKRSEFDGSSDGNSICKNIKVDTDIYAFKAKNNRERLFYIPEDFQTAEPLDNNKTYNLFNKKIGLKKIIVIAIVAFLATFLLVVLSNISYKHTQEKHQMKIDEEISMADEYIQHARDDIKQELYIKAQEDLDDIYGLDNIDYDYRGSERDSLFYYAELLSIRSNGAIVDEQYELIDNIEFAKDDEFYNDYQSVKSEIINEYNSAEVKGKLQHYFLAIDDKKTLEEQENDASAKGFYTEIADAGIMKTLYISEDETLGYGYGGEEWYMYENDHIEVKFFNNDDPGVWRPSFKSYSFQKKYMCVESDADGSDISTENRLPGYIGKGSEDYEKIENYESLEDAMKYANDYEYSEGE